MSLNKTILTVDVLYFSFRRHVQHSRSWRIAISAVLAAGTAPEIFPDMSGGFAHPHIFALFRWFPACLFDPAFYQSYILICDRVWGVSFVKCFAICFDDGALADSVVCFETLDK